MELQFYGANCFRIGNKKTSVIYDDNLEALGAKSVTKKEDVAAYSQRSFVDQKAAQEASFLIDGPGEYEIGDISIIGVSARSHMDEENAHKTATIYKLVIEDMVVVFLGHIYPELSDDQLEALGMVDVLVTPVGGNGYSLDSVGALQVIRKIEPKIVIPSHYDMKEVNYPVPQAPLDEFVKAIALEPEKTSKLKLKKSDISDQLKLIVLES